MCSIFVAKILKSSEWLVKYVRKKCKKRWFCCIKRIISYGCRNGQMSANIKEALHNDISGSVEKGLQLRRICQSGREEFSTPHRGVAIPLCHLCNSPSVPCAKNHAEKCQKLRWNGRFCNVELSIRQFASKIATCNLLSIRRKRFKRKKAEKWRKVCLDANLSLSSDLVKFKV